MGSNKEIISLQFGHYSNYVGTHLWNLQTFSFNYNPQMTKTFFNHDVLFREGKTLDNEITYTPRCIITDLKDRKDQISCLTNSMSHAFDAVTDNITETSAHTDAIPAEVKDIQTWNHFLKPHLHPKSVHIIDQCSFNNEQGLFDYYGQGSEAYELSKEEYDNKVHFFSEDCDYLQGFNIICDTYNAFGGVLNGLFDDIISNDFRNKTILVYSVRPPFLNKNRYEKHLFCLNSIISYVQMLNHNAFLVPLSVSRSLNKEDLFQQSLLTYDANVDYESSSILASAIHNNTLPLKLLKNPITMYDMLNPLSSSQNRVLSLNCCFPFNNKSDWMKSLENCEIKSLSAPSVEDYWTVPQQVCISGVNDYRPETSITFVEQKAKFMQPFPHIFRNNKYDSNWLEEHGMVTSLQAASSVGNHLDELSSGYEMNGNKNERALLSRLNLEADELRDILEQFKQIVLSYNRHNLSDMF